MLGRTNTGGGGGGLNFKVICNPQPSTAKENTIWIDTDRINNTHFSATQPENMADYDVWISTGTSSPASFNALKKGNVQVYPISAKQYISGAWEDKTAKSYQNGEWVDWFTYLIKNGTSIDFLALRSSISKSEAGLVITPAGANQTAIVYTKEKYDLTNVSKIVLSEIIGESKSYTANNGNKLPCIAISTKTPDLSNFIAFKEIGLNGTTLTVDDGGTELDVSAYTGLYYICIGIEAASTKDIVVSDLRVE